MSEPFTRAAVRLSGVEQRILVEAADRFDVLAKEAVARAVGGGTVMLMHTRNGRKAVRMGTEATMGTHVMFIEGTPRAHWTWIEKGTKPHVIPRKPKTGKKGRRRRRVVSSRPRRQVFLHAPGYPHPVRYLVHPGATGKLSWTQTVDAFRLEYPHVVLGQVRKALAA